MRSDDYKAMDLAMAAAEMSNLVYAAAVKLFEGLEHAGLINGNGHHAAQKLATLAAREVVERWREDKSNGTG